ncbi:hypothetical protein PRIPAC_97963 [Pristionchus pacificus]|uniref:Uncharacterized protein n=1 Tax=Pristionchus pacificus TaxID=54126 RepID=A0A2A6BCW6_PRIPA|nr:hypothetical protein PRIPAC_97963 [Pristionchus pacificus]|eukprot:PDM63714.1 hypothetical protein PRIPAC_49687 [Pristionchus pacificus]
MFCSPQEPAQIRDLRTKVDQLRKDRTHVEKHLMKRQARKESQQIGKTVDKVGNQEEIIERIDKKELIIHAEPHDMNARVPDLQRHQRRIAAHQRTKRASKRTIRQIGRESRIHAASTAR